MIVAACDPDSADAQLLLEELSDALAALTGDSGKASFSTEDARAPRSLFVLARDDEGGLLGCGALREIDGETGEIKRMYARPGTRAVGVALLRHLEQAATAFGYRTLCLETRSVNLRAVRFYEKQGYDKIANYGKYINRPEAVCFGKSL